MEMTTLHSTHDPSGQRTYVFQRPAAPATTTNDPNLIVVVYPDHTLAVGTTKENEQLLLGREGETEDNSNMDEEVTFQHPLLQPSTNASTMYMRLARYYSNPMRTRRRKFLISLHD